MQSSTSAGNLLWIAFLSFTILCSGCFPRTRSAGLGSEDSPASGSFKEAAKVDGEARSARSLLTVIDPQTYRFAARDEAVWNAALAVLMRNYNLVLLDRANGVITTEWDSFYLQDAVYRNKVSLRLSKQAYRSSILSIVNNTETLKDGTVSGTATSGPVWLPSDDIADESVRIVRNIAAYLEQAGPGPANSSQHPPPSVPQVEPNALPSSMLPPPQL